MMKEKKLLSIIVPCYNEEENVGEFYKAVRQLDPFFAERDLDTEILYIDDGSSDRTVDEVRKLRAGDDSVRLVSFSRNFGKEAAIYAGLQKSRGDYIVMMDADLQDPPSLLPEMFGYIDEGYDCAATRRVTRKGEPPIRSFFARRFYALINRFSKTEIVDGARDYRLMTRQMADAVLSLSEYNRFSKGIFSWVGFKTRWVEYENVERLHGETKWSFWSLFIYALDGIAAFTTAPLTMVAFIGLAFCVLAFFMIVFVVVRAAIFGDPTSGWPSLVCIILLVSGVQLLCLGIMGEYVGRIFNETKRRPPYLVDDFKRGESLK